MVLNIADMRLVHSREALKQLQERFGDKVFPTVIRRSVRYAESAERGVSIVDYAPDLGADYAALADEVLARLGGYEEAARAPRRLARRARARVGFAPCPSSCSSPWPSWRAWSATARSPRASWWRPRSSASRRCSRS